MSNLKDFNILGLKIDTSATKKDIAIVTGYNQYVQKIENVCKTQQGELPSSPYFGSNYFEFIFDPVSNKPFTEVNLEGFITNGVKGLGAVNVFITYFDEQKAILNINFTTSNYLKTQKMQCTIEVPLQ
jgi:hypothetical protein